MAAGRTASSAPRPQPSPGGEGSLYQNFPQEARAGSDPASMFQCGGPRPLLWMVDAPPAPGGLGTNKAVCGAGPQRVLEQTASLRGVGSACGACPPDTGAAAASPLPLSGPGLQPGRVWVPRWCLGMWEPAGLLDAPPWLPPLEKGPWQSQGWGGCPLEALRGPWLPSPTSLRAPALSPRALPCCQQLRAQARPSPGHSCQGPSGRRLQPVPCAGPLLSPSLSGSPPHTSQCPADPVMAVRAHL